MSSAFNGVPHRPVLYQEIIHALEPTRGGFFVDCTVGAGGHASGILAESAPGGRLLGMDVDPQALELARQNLAVYQERVVLVQSSYTMLSDQLDRLGWQSVDGILLDLGLSSMQLDTPERGFSFLSDAPLDMRFDPESPVSAADLVNRLSEKELADLIYRYGEETKARRIARAIVDSRPVRTTQELAEIVQAAIGEPQHISSRRAHPGRIHPATKTFQALRIAVNRELEALENVLPQAVDRLAEHGRLAVISFHSLEDRIVKQYFRQESKDCLCPPGQPVCTCGHRAKIREITRRPIRPAMAEIAQNPRARSARLRVAERLSY